MSQSALRSNIERRSSIFQEDGIYTDESHRQMSTEEIEIALSFLKKRFHDRSVDESISSLVQHIQRQQHHRDIPRQLQQYQPLQFNRHSQQRPIREQQYLPTRTKITNHNVAPRELSQNIPSLFRNNEEKRKKHEQAKLVARVFCETGINYPVVKSYFPDMTPQRYRSTIDKINGLAIRSITNFLRHQCNIQIQNINTDQKRYLKTELMRVRDWLGTKSMSQLDTYHKFIKRQYQQTNVDISYDEAIRLYKTLLLIIKSPYIDVMEVVSDDNQNFVGQRGRGRRGRGRGRQQNQMRINQQLAPPLARVRNLLDSAPISSYTKQEIRQVISICLQKKDINIASRSLNEMWGLSIKWTPQSIEQLLIYTIKKSINKILLAKDKYLLKTTPIFFGDSEQQISIILENEVLKSKILKFYISNRITATGLTNTIKELNLLLNKNDYSSYSQVLDEDDDEVSIIPKHQAELKQEHRSSPRPQARLLSSQETRQLHRQSERPEIQVRNSQELLNSDINMQNCQRQQMDNTRTDIDQEEGLEIN